MSNFLRLCFLCVLISNCAPEFVNDTRILAKGTLVDGAGVPIANRKVNINARNYPVLSDTNQNRYLLGSNITRSDGSFEVVALLVYNEDVYISINGGDDSVDYIYKTRIGDFVPNNLTFDLGTVVLRKKATVNYSISRTSAPGNSIAFSFSYQSPNCVEVYEFGVLIPEMSDCYSEQVRNGNLDDDNPDFSSQFESTLGSTVVFSYSINGAPTTTESFVIDQTTLDYEFNY